MEVVDRKGVALAAARAGGEVAADAFRGAQNVETKSGKLDLVTEADRAAQRRVFERLREAVPDEPIIGEEGRGPKTVPRTGAAWIVDPIDGTHNYALGIPLWGTVVAAVVDAEPVAAATVLPALGESYAADADGATRDGERLSVSDRTDPELCTVSPAFWRDVDRGERYVAATRATVGRFGDVRHFGSAHVTLALIAAGALDGAFATQRPHPWDSVAGAHLIRRAGGRVTDLEGGRWRHDSTGMVASNGEIHAELLAAAHDSTVS